MSDDDRLLSSIAAQRVLEDGCAGCGHSKVYCRAVLYLEQGLCCAGCDGHGRATTPDA